MYKLLVSGRGAGKTYTAYQYAKNKRDWVLVNENGEIVRFFHYAELTVGDAIALSNRYYGFGVVENWT